MEASGCCCGWPQYDLLRDESGYQGWFRLMDMKVTSDFANAGSFFFFNGL